MGKFVDELDSWSSSQVLSCHTESLCCVLRQHTLFSLYSHSDPFHPALFFVYQTLNSSKKKENNIELLSCKMVFNRKWFVFVVVVGKGGLLWQQDHLWSYRGQTSRHYCTAGKLHMLLCLELATDTNNNKCEENLMAAA